ncbi:ATP-binding protein [Bacillus aerolatus]|uniref:ATP-binding protein n=1 Tax=Bacillus aerolatus TaxID=2653354 RepID=A0A6I1FHC4_9BACI|nr:ATP-binding protein [Bacillus aerolatus]KAB7705381.1 ATP-binding protein [Bacillus aerolatus]
MNRDVLILPLDEKNDLIVAADNSGAVGEKPDDTVQALYETVGYFSARVALMECMAAGGEPFAAAIHNFSGEDAWPGLIAGVKKAAVEAGLAELSVTGSTESNFEMIQSATGVVVLGKKVKIKERPVPKNQQYAVIGKPLVGPEVLDEPEFVVPLRLFRQVLETEGVHAVFPVGSKGILHEIRNMSNHKDLQTDDIICTIDLKRSAGPSTCFIVGYNLDAEQALQAICGSFYTKVICKQKS